jgi:hypothetical protein
VLGAIPRQGSFPANTEYSLVEVISLAGGWSDLADFSRIRITRGAATGFERPVMEADLTNFLETGDVKGIPVVRPGDIVFVPKKENYVREFSEFARDVFLLFGFFSILR